MKIGLSPYVIILLITSLLTACHGQLPTSPTPPAQPTVNPPLSPFEQQVNHIASAAPKLYQQYQSVYQAVNQWIQHGADIHALSEYQLAARPLGDPPLDNKTLFTGYYTPVLQGRATAQGDFRYPLYGLPTSRPLPSRAQVYAGALSHQTPLAYTQSQLDNFMMQVQGSGFIDFADQQPPVFFAFAGKNSYPYRGIGRILVDRGEIAKGHLTAQAIRDWTLQHTDRQVQELLEHNPSYVFFVPQKNALVVGASGVPLVAKVAVAADPKLIAPGSVLLAQLPILDDKGRQTSQYQPAILIALDVGSAIKGAHLDLYQGIGDQAGHQAGFYNHYGQVWLLGRNSWLNPPAASPVLNNE